MSTLTFEYLKKFTEESAGWSDSRIIGFTCNTAGYCKLMNSVTNRVERATLWKDGGWLPTIEGVEVYHVPNQTELFHEWYTATVMRVFIRMMEQRAQKEQK